MTAVRTILTRAVRLLGAVAQGTPLMAGDAADALTALNGMLQAWNLESLLVFTENFDAYNLVPGQQIYTIGPTGNIAVPAQQRPTNLYQVQLQVTDVTPNLFRPIDIINDEEWADLRIQQISTAYPTKLYNDGDFPNSGLYLYPIPTMAYKLILWTWNQLSVITDINGDLSLPPGYERAIIYNLAVEIAAEYGRTPSPQVIQIANDSLALIKRSNHSNSTLKCDAAVLSGRDSRAFNWRTGE